MHKCIHIDMDCFYAAIEERENPSLKGQAIAVGGASPRGVVCTANYEARKFGIHSAMPGFKARQLCPHLIMLPVRMDLYKAESKKIHTVFKRFTNRIEPLSLDEAYLDVSHWKSQPSAIASEIRAQIYEKTSLTASAGIAPNKMLAKIASDWNKPNGQFEIRPEDIPSFMLTLPVSKLWGVGKRMQEKLARLNVTTCGDLQQFDQFSLSRQFGKWGLDLYRLSRGQDKRKLKTRRSRKTISKETTFPENIPHIEALIPRLRQTMHTIEKSLTEKYHHRKIRSLIVKLKFSDFTQTTAERTSHTLDETIYTTLLTDAWTRGNGKPVRLFGLGIRLAPEKGNKQLDLFP